MLDSISEEYEINNGMGLFDINLQKEVIDSYFVYKYLSLSCDELINLSRMKPSCPASAGLECDPVFLF